MDTILQYKTLVLLIFAVVFLTGERLNPAAPVFIRTSLGRARRIAKNIALLLVNAGLSPLVVIPLSAAAASHAPEWQPEWSQWMIVNILVLDIWIYWWHRANHEIQFLWNFHEIHHLDETLDVTSATRFHFGEVLLSATVRAAVIFLLAIPITHVVVFETLVLMSAIFHHSNVKVPPAMEGPLSRLLVTPSLHWVHHHALRRDTDSNYSSLLSVWDRAFGTRSATLRSPQMPIGVEGRRDEGLLGLVGRPFRRFFP